MPITAEQRERRRGRLGASDIAAVLGLDPYKSAYDVYLEKTLATDDIDDNEAIDIGNRFERPLLEWAAEQLGITVELDDPAYLEVSRADDSIAAANLDARQVVFTGGGGGLPTPGDVGLEAKTTSNPQEWGDQLVDEVPDRVAVQTTWQCYVADLRLVWVPVLMAKRDRLHRRLYRVDRDPALLDVIVPRCHAWWEHHVVGGVPPSDSVPSLELLARVRRIPDKVAAIDAEVVEAWDAARAVRLAAEKDEEAAKALLLAALGDAEAADYGDPVKIVTYLSQSRRGIDSGKLKREFPEVAEAVEAVSAFRVLRNVKRK
ncbi:MAG TPA: hypothetical protein DCY40_03855 [Actinobacteria bacterium]|nr:hypothetical protein [Actinomycetota bacterium]